MKGGAVVEKKKIREYRHDEVKAAVYILIFFIAFCVLMLIPSIDKVNKLIVTTLYMPITYVIMKSIIMRMLNSNSFIDIKVCTYQYILSKNVIDVWTIAGVEQSELENSMFLEVNNIGETMVNLIKIIINHNDEKNQNYIIQYALKKNDSIYFAISWLKNPLNYINDITVIDYAGRDTGRSFYGNLCAAGNVYIFPEVEGSKENRKPDNVYCCRLGLPQKQPSEK